MFEFARHFCLGTQFLLLAQRLVEGCFPGMAKRSVAYVVPQSDGFDQVLVEPEGSTDGSGYLGDFERVGEPGSVVVAGRIDEDLRLVFEPAKRLAMEDAVAVALETGAHRVGRFFAGSARAFRRF